MTPTQLQQFLAILDSGSLGQAARRLNISEPALSKRLKELEISVGVPLMERTPRGMTPTPFGACLEHHARIIRGEFDRARENIAVIKEGREGRLSIGFSPSFGPGIVADAMVAFLKRRPGVQVVTHEYLAHELTARLLRSEIDLSVMTLEQRIPHNEFVQIRLATDTVMLIARAEHPLAKRKRVRLGELQEFPWLLAKPGDRLRGWLEQQLSHHRIKLPAPGIEFDSVSFAQRMLSERDYLTFLPSTIMHDGLRDNRFVPIAVPELRWQRTVGIMHRRTHQSPLAMAMIQALKVSGKAYQQLHDT